MLDKKNGYADHRPFYPVDPNASIQSGMIAFMIEDVNGNPMVTTAANTASGSMVPIGTFWKDASAQYVRTWGENVTFDTNNLATFSKGNFHSLSELRVCNLAQTVDYTQALDFNAVAVNGILTRLGGGSIGALATVTVFATYNVMAGQEWQENVSTQWTNGSTMDRLANDTLGSGKITIAEGIATLYTDQYDVTQTYKLGDTLRCNADSKWTNLPAGTGLSSACGRVIKVNTATNPFLGLEQIRVVA